jgi:hypothetical protein
MIEFWHSYEPGTTVRRCSLRPLMAAVLALALATGLAAQAPAAVTGEQKASSRISPEQAKKLFALVDPLLKFSSEETGLPIKSSVHRRLTTRDEVERYLNQKMNEDESAKRLQRDEIVLKKFGLLDRDFALKPFLLALLKEQVEAYYDPKTKTVNLLDWVDVEEQKPVLAHELTHALQDQHCSLERWGNQTPDEVSSSATADRDHLAKDEIDTARDAVVEGQATAVMMDYVLRPLGKSLVKDPEVIEFMRQQMSGGTDSPVMARAPLLLSESMLFPYREGLGFEQDIWMEKGRTAAFAGMLDRPPSSSWEILNPREYEQQHAPAVPLMPDIHPLVDTLYRPYDIGQIGQLDLRTMLKLFGGDEAARNLTSAWNGGFYWAGQQRNGTQTGTASLALLYLSSWRNPASARAFAKLYGDNLAHKYNSVKLETTEATPGNGIGATQIYATSEGPVLVAVRGKNVVVTESFPLPLAHTLVSSVLDAQGSGVLLRAALPATLLPPSAASQLARTLHSYGTLKTATRAVLRVQTQRD